MQTYTYKDVKTSTNLKLDQYHTVLNFLNINWKLGKSTPCILSEKQYKEILDIVEKHGIGFPLSNWIKEQNSLKKYGLTSPNKLKSKREKISKKLKEKAERGEVFGFVGLKPEQRWNYKSPEQKEKEAKEKQKLFEETQYKKYGENWKQLSATDKTKITQLKENKYITKVIKRKQNYLNKYPGYVFWHDTKWQSIYFLQNLIKNKIIQDVKSIKSMSNLVSIKEIEDHKNEIEDLYTSYINKGCFSGKSYAEDEIAEFLKNNRINFIRHDRLTIKPKELDFLIPNKKIAIEFDGLYWHSDDRVSSTYHLEKTESCLEKGIRLIHIFEDDWVNKRDIVKSIILAACGIYKTRIFARNCIFKKINTKEGNEFFTKNHIAGSVKVKSEYYALFFNNEIVQCIQIGLSRFEKNTLELIRMCTKLNTQVLGGFSKLMKNQPYDNIISYVNRALFNRSGYTKTNWNLIDITKPNYYYFKYNEGRKNRTNFQKYKLKSLLENFDPNLTEYENMKNNGYSVIYDCGNYKMLWSR